MEILKKNNLRTVIKETTQQAIPLHGLTQPKNRTLKNRTFF